MKVKLLLIAAAVFALAAVSFGQPFNVSLNTDVVLTTTCGGQVPLADGTPVMIYWDSNSNGPDPADPLATLCNSAPNCDPSSPVGSVNYNTFLMNGESWNGIPGTFSTEQNFVCVGNLPSPSRFYLVVTSPTAVYTSAVFTLAAGPGDIFISSWTCTTPVPSCTPSPDTYFEAPHAPGNPDLYACVTLCRDHTQMIYVGPLAGPDRVPHITITPGCELCGNPNCTPAGGWNLSPFAWVNINGLWYYQASLVLAAGVTEGCVCLHFDAILAVSMGDVAVTPMDNSVKVAWNTLSESNFNRFEVTRDGQTIARIEAKNVATGANYEYVDNTAVNGTTYHYNLVWVDNNEVRTVVLNEAIAATPSFDAAVVTEYALHQNFPNPFNPTTKIAFDLVDNNTVSLTVYNAAGQEVTTLMSNRSMTKGRHSVSFDATNLPSGLYFYTIKIGNEFSATKKMLLVK